MCRGDQLWKPVVAGDVCWTLKGVLLAYKIQNDFTNPLAFVGDHFSGVLSCE